MFTWLTASAAISFSAALSGCSFDEARVQCTSSNDCSSNQECYRGFCVSSESGRANTGGSGGTRGGAGKGGASGSGKPDGTGTTVNPSTGTPMAGRNSTQNPRDAGNDSGPLMSMMPDATPDTPAPDTCKAGDTHACTVTAPSSGANNGCGPGKQNCENGMFGPCIPERAAAAESCNGIDDDCDGKTDENPAPECYPSGPIGCPAPGTGMCNGLCAFGKQLCVDGKLQDCSSAKTPQAETCTNVGEIAADEDCDGVIDESCACTGNQERDCYTGPAGTTGAGKECKPGKQTCSNGAYGPCLNAVTPQAETCANETKDNDCNGTVDDIRDRNAVCSVPGAQGNCAVGTLQCQAGSADLKCVSVVTSLPETCNGFDDDCDGKVDNGFDLQTDAKHCGSCLKSCGASETCCAGKCVDTSKDNANCGGCGTARACATGTMCCSGMCAATCGGTTPPDSGTPTCPTCAAGETCCDGKCVNLDEDVNHCGSCTTVCSGTNSGCCTGKCTDLTADKTCGSCTNACGALKLGTEQCTCRNTDAGFKCAGLSLAGLLEVCLLPP